MDIATRMKKDHQPRSRHYEPDVKLRILHMLERGNVPPEDIAESFGVSKQIIYVWRRAYKKHGMAGLADAPKSGRPPAVSKKQIRRCIRKVGKESVITVRRLRAAISKRYGVRFSANHVCRMLHGEGLGYKKANPVPVDGTEPRIRRFQQVPD